MKDYLARLDDAAFGAASEVTPKFVSPSDPAAQWTGALRGPTFLAYATNYLVDTDHAIIADVEATRAIRQAEVGEARTMIERVMDRFGLHPERPAGGSAYGAAEMPGWLAEDQGIEPYVTVFDKSERDEAPSPAVALPTITRAKPISARWARFFGRDGGGSEENRPASPRKG